MRVISSDLNFSGVISFFAGHLLATANCIDSIDLLNYQLILEISLTLLADLH